MAGASKAAELMKRLSQLRRERAERLFDEGGEGVHQFSLDALEQLITRPDPIAILDPDEFFRLVSKEQSPDRRSIAQRAQDVKPHLGKLANTGALEWMMSGTPGIGHVTGHEGRARSRAFKNFGIEEYPVPFMGQDINTPMELSRYVKDLRLLEESPGEWASSIGPEYEHLIPQVESIMKAGGPSFEDLLTERLGIIPDRWLGEDTWEDEVKRVTAKINKGRFFAKGGDVKDDADFTYEVDPKTGRLIKVPLPKLKQRDVITARGGLAALADRAGLKMPRSLRRAVEDYDASVEPTVIDKQTGAVSGGPGVLDTLSAIDIPFQAAGEEIFSRTGSPLAGTAAYVLPGVVSPRSVARAGRAASRAVKGAAKALDPRNLAVPIEQEATDLVLDRMGKPKSPGVLREGAETARSLLNQLQERAGAYGDILSPAIYAVKPKGGQWLDTKPLTHRTNPVLRQMEDEAGPSDRDIDRIHENAQEYVFENPEEFGFTRKELEEIGELDEEHPRYQEYEEMVDRVAENMEGDFTADPLIEDYLTDPEGFYGVESLAGLGPEELGHISGAQWTDKNFDRWIKTHLGTEVTDELAREFGLPADTFDRMVRQAPASLYQSAITPWGAPDPNVPDWMRKLAPEEPIYRLNEQDFEQSDLWRSMQDYMAQHPNPERLKNISVPDMLRQSRAWHEALAKKMTDDAIAAGTTKVLREYPEGMRWVEITRPSELPEGYKIEPKMTTDAAGQPVPAWYTVIDPQGKPVSRPHGGEHHATEEEARDVVLDELLRQGLDAEGRMMGHCVGSYCEQVKRDGTRILSLRDKTGKPHVTLEVGAPPGFEAESMAADLLKEELGDAEYQKLSYPDIKRMIGERKRQLPMQIRQIKGKENRAPIADYQRYVQDVIRNPVLGVPWSRVHELENAGLVQHSGHYWTRDQLERAAQEFGNLDQEVANATQNFIKMRGARGPKGDEEARARKLVLDEFIEGGHGLELPPDFDVTKYAGGGKVLKEGAEIARSLLRKLQEKAGAFGDILDPAMYAVKEKGGQWIEPELQNLNPGVEWLSGERLMDVLGDRGRDIWEHHRELGPGNDLHRLVREQYPEEWAQLGGTHPAVDEWLNKNFMRWVKTDMGTEATDALARELGDSPRRYDDPITKTSARDRLRLMTKDAERWGGVPPEWLGRLAEKEPMTPVHRVNPALMDASFMDVLDYVRSGDIPPERLKNVSVPDMIRKSKAWHDAIAAKKTEEALKAGTTRKIRDYPEQGMSWMELVAPEQVPEGWTFQRTVAPGGGEWVAAVDPQGKVLEQRHFNSQEEAEKAIKRHVLKQGLDAEGQMMGHCVGKEGSPYCDAVLAGRSRILSLRDETGRPHVTVEVASAQPVKEPEFDVINDLIELNSPFEAEALARLGEDAPPIEWIKDVAKHHPSEARRMTAERLLKGYAARPPQIRQIKGKENRAPVEKYRSFAQDLVRNPPFEGGWENVGDLHNIDMTRFISPFTVETRSGKHDFGAGYFTKEDMIEQMMASGLSAEDAAAMAAQYFSPGRSYFAEGGPVEEQEEQEGQQGHPDLDDECCECIAELFREAA